MPVLKHEHVKGTTARCRSKIEHETEHDGKVPVLKHEHVKGTTARCRSKIEHETEHDGKVLCP